MVYCCCLFARFESRLQLDKLHPLIHPLLQWLYTSSRSHLRMLKPAERIPGIETDLQFVMVCLTSILSFAADYTIGTLQLSASPDREAKWRAMKVAAERSKGKGNGSVFMFHGSPSNSSFMLT